MKDTISKCNRYTPGYDPGSNQVEVSILTRAERRVPGVFN